MLQTLLLAAALALQDPKPAPKTVEDRLKELDEKIALLDKKSRQLTEENKRMEAQLAEVKATRDRIARSTADGWVQLYAKPAGLTPEQTAELKTLRFDWMMEDLDQPFNAARWAVREATLKSKLSSDQTSRLSRTVREHQISAAEDTLFLLIRRVNLDAEKTAVLKKTTLDKLQFDDGVLIIEAHPEKVLSWTKVHHALESSLPEMSAALSEEEQAALRKALEQSKPRTR